MYCNGLRDRQSMSHGKFMTTQFSSAPVRLTAAIGPLTLHKAKIVHSRGQICITNLSPSVNMKVACMQQTTITQLNVVSSSRANPHPRSFLPCSLPQRQHARRQVQIRAQQQQQQTKPEVAKFADSVGLPTEEGLFGFKPFPEVRHYALVATHLGLLCTHVVQPCTLC